ncbi:MAG: type II secretion system protein [Dialister sp.]|nr:type II secretion system protein [Dialister sp.]MDY2811896.1 type II secretion system protein [Dialister sp.]MDY5379344.1 type II secretion system protein [Dialister sp.]
MKTHRGFLMVWALAGITVILILAGSVALTLSQAMRREVRMEIATDEALIVQEALEQGKAAVRFGTPLSILRDIERNGRMYRVDFHQEETAVEGAAVIRLSCEVTHESGETYRAETLVDR